MSAARPRFSIEGVVLGRNDDYEPGWTDRLYGSLRYNHELFAARGVDYRVAFVEWNPPEGRPLLSPDLTKAFPFLRAIIIDAAVHQALCTADDLTMMLNFAYNPALRTSTADYCLITSGDLFFGRALADRIARGLAPGFLYRAERVNIREELADRAPDVSVIEDPGNIVSVDTCSEPPYDTPPYTHASGDFLMVDRVTMAGLRGFDESIRFARLHLDSRFCRTAMLADLDCELLGRIYHINHRNAYSNRPNDYPGRRYAFEANLPYLNPPDWGLARMAWTREDDRTWRVGLPVRSAEDAMPPGLTGNEITRADEITRRLVERREHVHPDQPLADAPISSKDIGLEGLRSLPHWTGAATEHGAGTATVTSVDAPWGHSAEMLLTAPSAGSDTEWMWLHVRATPMEGAVGVGIAQNYETVHERFLSAREAVNEVWLPLPRGRSALIIRNGADAGPSRIRVESLTVVSQPKQPIPREQFLLSPR